MITAGDTIVNRATGHRYQIVKSGVETQGALLEMLADFPVDVPQPPEHFHPDQEERFEVIDGALEVRVNGSHRRLTPGEVLVIPAGTHHAMWTTPTTTARVRWETRPALHAAEFLATAARLAAEGRVSAKGTPGLLDGALLLNTYRNEFRLSTPPAFVQRLLFGLLAAVARLAGRQL